MSRELSEAKLDEPQEPNMIAVARFQEAQSSREKKKLLRYARPAKNLYNIPIAILHIDAKEKLG